MEDNSMGDNSSMAAPPMAAPPMVAPVVNRTKRELADLSSTLSSRIGSNYLVDKNVLKQKTVSSFLNGQPAERTIGTIQYEVDQFLPGLDYLKPPYQPDIQTKINQYFTDLTNAIPLVTLKKGGRRRTKRSQSKRRRQSKRRGQSRRRARK